MDERDQRLVRAHDDMLKAAASMLEGVPVNVDGKPGQVTVFATVARVIQIGCAVQDLMERGYGEEAAPLARSMLSGAMTVVALVDADTDGRALAYQMHAEKYENTLIDRAEKYEIFDREQAARERRKTADRFRDGREMFARNGVTPARLGDSDRCWHGLNSDKALFEKMGWSHIYELDYAWLSDEVHFNIGAIGRELSELFDQNLSFGPKGQVDDKVLKASADAVLESLVQLSNLLQLGKREEIMAIETRFNAALHVGR